MTPARGQRWTQHRSGRTIVVLNSGYEDVFVQWHFADEPSSEWHYSDICDFMMRGAYCPEREAHGDL